MILKNKFILKISILFLIINVAFLQNCLAKNTTKSLKKDTMQLYFFGSIPISLVDETGTITGFFPELLHEVLRRNNIPYRDMINNPDSYNKAMSEGKIDMTITAKHMTEWDKNSPCKYDLSSTGIPLEFGFLTRRFSSIDSQNKLFEKKTVFLRTFSNQEIPYDILDINKENTTLVTSFKKSIQMLDDKEVDVIVGQIPTLMYYLQKEGNIHNYNFYPIKDKQVTLRIALKQNCLLSITQLDSTINELKKDSLSDNLWIKWCITPQIDTVNKIHTSLLFLSIILLIIVTSLFIFSIHTYKTFKKNSKRKESFKSILDYFPLGIKIELLSTIKKTAYYNKVYKNNDFENFEKVESESMDIKEIPSKNSTISYLHDVKKNLFYEKNETLFSVKRKNYIITIYTDITKLKDARERIKRYENIKRKFISNLGKDIKEPIESILQNSESLKDNDSKDNYEKIATTINSSSENLLSLITNILESSK